MVAQQPINIREMQSENAERQLAELREGQSVAASCFEYFLIVIVAYVVISDAVTRGMLRAWKKRDADQLKAAVKAETAAQARRAATPAPVARSSASPGSAPPGASGTPRKA
jgi:hypothetical protein